MTGPVWGPVQVPRDGRGNPKVKEPDSNRIVSYLRTTTFVECLEDQSLLMDWKQRKVAEGLAIRPDLVLRANSLGLEPPKVGADGYADQYKVWRTSMNALCKQATDAAQATARATIGTSLHALCERLDRGQKLGAVPSEYRPHLTAYLKAVRELGLTMVEIEQFSVCDELRAAGTPDRVVKIDGEPGLFIADIKTGSLDFGLATMAMQLAVYAHSVKYDPANSARQPYAEPVNTDRGLIIGLNADTGICEPVWINLAAGWEGVQIATQVRTWRNRRDIMLERAAQVITSQPVSVEPPPPMEDPLLARIDTAPSFKDLVDLWKAAGDAWTEEHTARAAARKTQIRRAA